MAFASLTRRQAVTAVASPREALRAGRVATRALAAATPEADRVALARGFGRRVVEAWWRALMGAGAPLRELLQPFDTSDLPASVQALADSVGEVAAQLDDETAAYEIGLAYTGMLPAAYRGQHGVYYTPPALTARLIDQATWAGTDWTSARVLDPACGGGAFLAPVVQRIIAALPGRHPRILIQNIATRLRGYEIDPFAAWFSQVALDAALLPIARAAGAPPPRLIDVRDSLRAEPPPDGFDLVIGNPPYGRVTLPAADRLRYRRGLFGHANLYGLFTDMALRHCKAGGVIAYVTPTSFLAGEYFKQLRALMAREAPPASLDFVAARKGVFDDVLQETVLATYRRGAGAGPITVHEIATNDGADVTVTPACEIDLPSDPAQPWLAPRDPGQTRLVARLAAMPCRLADWGYTVSTGPLVWNRHKDQLVHAPGKGRHPLIWAEALTAEGEFIFRAERRGHAPYFQARRGDDWLVVRRPCVLVQRTTAKEQARRLIAAALPEAFIAENGGVVVENHLNMIRAEGRPRVAPAVLAAFIMSGAADRAFRCVSGSVAVSAYELEALPLPAPDALGELSALVGEDAGRARIDAACDRLYDGGR
jgi:adenine-specific DNA-methyltransferase